MVRRGYFREHGPSSSSNRKSATPTTCARRLRRDGPNVTQLPRRSNALERAPAVPPALPARSGTAATRAQPSMRKIARTVAWLTARPAAFAGCSAACGQRARRPHSNAAPRRHDVNIPIVEREEYRELVTEYPPSATALPAWQDVELPPAAVRLKSRRHANRIDKTADDAPKCKGRDRPVNSITTRSGQGQSRLAEALAHPLYRLRDDVGLAHHRSLPVRFLQPYRGNWGRAVLDRDAVDAPVCPGHNTEGNYVFISKNVIELIALLLLACIPSGRWFGWTR